MPAKVMLNIYDMAAQNQFTYWFGLGVFHAGVEVYGVEWAYGGHGHDSSGVFATSPRDAPGQVVFRESLCMGETSLSQSDVERLVFQLGADFKGINYHLLQRNCNHFADDLCRQLVGKEMPSWINRLASTAVMLHCLLPTMWVPSLETPKGYLFNDSYTEGLISNGRCVIAEDVYWEERRKGYYTERLRRTQSDTTTCSYGGNGDGIPSPTAAGIHGGLARSLTSAFEQHVK